MEKTYSFSMFLFNNAFKILVIGSAIYLVYKNNSKIIGFGLFKGKTNKNEIIEIIEDILSENNSSKLIQRLPIENNQLKGFLERIIPNIEIEIKPGFSFVSRILNRKNKLVTKGQKDQILIDSILEELRNNPKQFRYTFNLHKVIKK